jgi:tetrahydromethanopterin S-methyltransferase subunit G
VAVTLDLIMDRLDHIEGKLDFVMSKLERAAMALESIERKIGETLTERAKTDDPDDQYQ